MPSVISVMRFVAFELTERFKVCWHLLIACAWFVTTAKKYVPIVSKYKKLEGAIKT